MKRVFADTACYQALLMDRDAWHEAAKMQFHELDAELVTTDYILVEMGALMSRGAARMVFTKFMKRIRSDESTTIVPASRDLLDDGFALFAARPDKAWSLTDCISFAVMRRYNITDVLTTDRHFDQAGFNVALRR